MRSRTDFTVRCQRCHQRADLCLCAEVPQIRTRTRLVVVRHSLEAKRSSNTGRIALLGLPDATLVEYGGPERAFDLEGLVGDGAWLLFPDGATTPAEPPRTLVVIDASWAQARRMVQRVPRFRSLPRLALPAGEALPRLRVAPRADGMSTIEAMVRALDVLEGPGVAGPLEALCRLHATRSQAAKGVPGVRTGRVR